MAGTNLVPTPSTLVAHTPHPHQESEEEAKRQRETEEAAFEEQMQRALQESEALAAAPAPVGYADEDEEALLRRVLEESAREEEARTRAAADEEQLLIAKIMRESLEEAYMPALRSSIQQQQPQHMDDEEFERALAASRIGGAGVAAVSVAAAGVAAAGVAAAKLGQSHSSTDHGLQMALASSVADEEVQGIVREIKELRGEFKAPLDVLQAALVRVCVRACVWGDVHAQWQTLLAAVEHGCTLFQAKRRADRAAIERDLAAARESRNPNSVSLSAQLARSGKELREVRSYCTCTCSTCSTYQHHINPL